MLPPNPIICRLIVDPPAPGMWNMAVDEALFEQAAKFGTPTLRFYQWSEPTLSLGYFQNYGDRRSHAASLETAAVRRTTGGGAILHDHELTYSLVWPAGQAIRAGRRPDFTWLYNRVHTAMQQVLTGYNIGSELFRSASPPRPVGEPFLCFQRRSTGDLLIGEEKILGSAQRRRRETVLQHGSLVLSTSEQAPEIQGILQLVGGGISTDRLADDWSGRLQTDLVLELESGVLNDGENRRAEEIARSKFGQSAWTKRR
ncbi:MAG: hypothetical protein VB875_14745 [Pirellulales bacterium]